MNQSVNQQKRINALRTAGILLLPALLFVHPSYPPESATHETYEAIGLLLLFAGVFGRFWSILYVGSRKNAQLVQDGPYSMTRNPLYFFSTVATLGIGLMMGSLVLAALLTLVVGVTLYLTARKERAFLAREFGDDYARYAGRVAFFFPDPRLFHTEPEIVFSTLTLKRNFVDATVFLSFIPLVEVLDMAKESILPVWLTLP